MSPYICPYNLNDEKGGGGDCMDGMGGYGWVVEQERVNLLIPRFN